MSFYRYEPTSALRSQTLSHSAGLAFLFKYGGHYVDLNMILRKPIIGLKHNYFAIEQVVVSKRLSRYDNKNINCLSGISISLFDGLSCVWQSDFDGCNDGGAR